MSDLPHGWRTVRLNDLGTWYGGATPSKSRPDYWEAGTVPWLSPKDMGPSVLTGTQDRITEAAVTNSSVRRVPNESVALVVRSGILERTIPVALVPFETTLNQDMKAVAPSKDVDSRWVAWGLRAMERQLLRSCRKAGTTVASLEVPRLMQQLLPVPPLDEQRRIVEILEDHLSRLDAAVASLERATKALQIVGMASLVAVRRELLQTGTPFRRIGDSCETALGKMLDAKRAAGTPTPYLRNANVRWGRFDLSDVASVRLSRIERQRLSVQSGDLMVCEGGEPGRCAVWRGGGGSLMTYQKALHRVRIRRDEDLLPNFVAAMLEETIRTGRADRLFTGTTIKHLPQEKLRTIEIPVPTVEVQRRLLARLAEQEEKLQRCLTQMDEAQSRSIGLRRVLVQAALSGSLTRGSTTEESVKGFAHA